MRVRGWTPNSLLIKYEKRMEKKQEVVVLRQSENATQVMIKNPSEKLLAFMEELEERKKRLKKEISRLILSIRFHFSFTLKIF